MDLRSAEERYLHDPIFHQFVVSIQQVIETLEMTPSEVREACIFACVLAERNRLLTVGMRYPDDFPSMRKP